MLPKEKLRSVTTHRLSRHKLHNLRWYTGVAQSGTSLRDILIGAIRKYSFITSGGSHRYQGLEDNRGAIGTTEGMRWEESSVRCPLHGSAGTMLSRSLRENHTHQILGVQLRLVLLRPWCGSISMKQEKICLI